MKAVLDESTPEDRGGVFYVIAAAIIVAKDEVARETLVGTLPQGRRRPFHWKLEGPQARSRMLSAIEELGVVAHVCTHYPTGRTHLERAREAATRIVVPKLLRDGVDELIIEARNPEQDDRDRRVIRDILLHHDPRPDLTYRWATKGEPVMWMADAIAGAVRTYLLREDDGSFEQLRAAGVLREIDYIAGA